MLLAAAPWWCGGRHGHRLLLCVLGLVAGTALALFLLAHTALGGYNYTVRHYREDTPRTENTQGGRRGEKAARDTAYLRQLAKQLAQNPCTPFAVPPPPHTPAHMPKIFHQLWVGRAHRAPLEVMTSCRDLVEHHGFVYVLWSEALLGRLLQCDPFARQLGMTTPKLRAAVARNDRHTVLKYADILRLMLLWHHGGVYVDVDTLCLRDLSPLLRIGRDHECFAAYENRDKGDTGQLVANGVQGCRANSSTVHTLLTELATHRNPWTTVGAPWQVTGPLFLADMTEGPGHTPFIRKVGTGPVDYHKLPHHLFHPVHHSEIRALGREGAREYGQVLGSYLVSLWGTTTDLY